jgi:uncharacterized membrane protein
MTDSKAWYASTGVWGGIVAIGAAALGAFGYALAPGDQAQLAEWIATLGGIAGGLAAIVGRVRASKRIG